MDISLIFYTDIRYMDFFDRTKQLVKSNTSFTIRSFIESLGINYDSYNGLKRYGNLPRADEAVKIAAALGTSVEYLVTGESSGLPDDIIQTVAMLKELPPDERGATIAIVKSQFKYWKSLKKGASQ